MTTDECFDYIDQLWKGNPTVYTVAGLFVEIEKLGGPDDPCFRIGIKNSEKSEKFRDTYILTDNGLEEAVFEYPPVIDIPPAPTNFPADLNDQERAEWLRAKAEAVVNYFKTRTLVQQTMPVKR